MNEPEPNEPEARRLLCGCVEWSDGEIDLCLEHCRPQYDYDPDHWNPAEGGNKVSDDYW